MKIPFPAPCTECKTDVEAFMDLNAGSLHFDCPHGHSNSYSLDLGFTVGVLLLRRAEFEFRHNQDFPMTIVMSAMAFECELSRLHHKCEQLAALEASQWLDDSALDEKLRKYPNIRERIEAVCSMLHGPGLDDFVSATPELHIAIQQGFPSLVIGSLARSFQEVLFWPRNGVLHLGATAYTRDDAVKLYNVANIGVVILNRMDAAKWHAGSV